MTSYFLNSNLPQPCGTTGTPSCAVYFLQQNAMPLALGGILFAVVVVYLLDKRLNPFVNPTWSNILVSLLILIGILAILGFELWPVVFKNDPTMF